MYPRLGCPASWENRNFSSDQQEILFLLMLELKIPQGERERGTLFYPCGARDVPHPLALRCSPSKKRWLLRALGPRFAPSEAGPDSMVRQGPVTSPQDLFLTPGSGFGAVRETHGCRRAVLYAGHGQARGAPAEALMDKPSQLQWASLQSQLRGPDQEGPLSQRTCFPATVRRMALIGCEKPASRRSGKESQPLLMPVMLRTYWGVPAGQSPWIFPAAIKGR